MSDCLVLNNNNVVTMNAFLIEPFGGGNGGGSGTSLPDDGRVSVILISNNNDVAKHLNVVLEEMVKGSASEVYNLMELILIPSPEMWTAWESTGFKGEGVEIIAERKVKVLNLETAALLKIPFEAHESQPIGIQVVIDSTGSNKTPLLPNNDTTASLDFSQLPNYQFVMTHAASYHSVKRINPSSACLFTVPINKWGDILEERRNANTVFESDNLLISPNPFSHQIQVELQLKAPTSVQLRVYDMQSKLIKTLINQPAYRAGKHLFTYDFVDLPSGIYFYQLETNDTQLTKKVVKMD